MARPDNRGIPSFDDLSHDVWEEILRATNHYDLVLKRVLLPIVGQRMIRGEFSFTVKTLVYSVGEHVLLNVCRLFDPKPDKRMTSLSNLLRGAVEHHAGDSGLSPRQAELRADFETRLPERLAEIKRRWKTLLVIHRNAYLAHRDLAKLDALPEMTYLDIRAAIDLAQTYYASCAHTYLNQEKEQYWRLMQYESEPEGFLKWCRLDDYERHVREDDQRAGGRYPGVSR